jgi:hypothetical protein
VPIFISIFVLSLVLYVGRLYLIIGVIVFYFKICLFGVGFCFDSTLDFMDFGVVVGARPLVFGDL